MATRSPSSIGTLTLTLEEPRPSSSSSSSSSRPAQSVVLRLKRAKKVSWKEGTVDNEFLNRKSSKKCCIFHKQLPFDEDCSDDDHDVDAGARRGDPPPGMEGRAGTSRCCSHVGTQ